MVCSNSLWVLIIGITALIVHPYQVRNVHLETKYRRKQMNSEDYSSLHHLTSPFILRLLPNVQLIEPFIPYSKDNKNKINQIVDSQLIEQIRIRHIKLNSKELALECKQLIKQNMSNFESLANSISLCPVSKGKGGELGWHQLKEYGINVVSVDDSHRIVKGDGSTVIPLEVIEASYHLNIGDLIITSSQKETFWHLVQLMDVVMKLSPSIKKRQIDRFQLLSQPRNNAVHTVQSTRSSYAIDTMGCQMNVADSERMEGQLRELGYHRADRSEEASLVILNTCAIRDHAESKVYSYLGPHALRKRQGEEVSIIVAGCVAQQEGDELLRRFPEVDVVMGPQYTNRLSDLLESAFEGNQVVATDPAYQTEDVVSSVRKSVVTAFVNIIYGCNERCTYCVVPNTRGVEQSRTMEAILQEVGDLARLGYQEVTLLGQNIDSWGRNMDPKQRFSDLLAAVGRVPGLKRVRFLTSHPRYMSGRVIQAVADNPEVLMPCFNVPFQSGDNDVLQMMRRGYTRERYLEIIHTIRDLMPDAAITTDCIVGFPGETEEQFQRTLDLLEEVRFEQVNAHAYSARPHTPAGIWSTQLSEEVKQDRLQRIKRLSSVHAMERSMRFVNRIDPVLVEDVNPKDPSQVFGRNPHSRLVFFPGRISELRGKIVPVLITEAKAYYLFGRISEEHLAMS